MNMERGVIYLAIGKKYFDEAVFSASSLKKYNPSLPITLFCDDQTTAYQNPVFDEVIPLAEKAHPMRIKISAILKSPYTHTLFLDTDTKIVGDITGPFTHLQQYDMAIAAMRWLHPNRQFKDFEKPSPARPENMIYNTGVIYYKKSSAFLAFGKIWLSRNAVNNETVLHAYCDQQQFNDMLDEKTEEATGLRIKKISNKIYNCRLLFLPHMSKEERRQIMIYHEHYLNKPVMLVRKKIKDTIKKLIKWDG